MVMIATNATAITKIIIAHPGICCLVLMQYISQNPVPTTVHNNSARIIPGISIAHHVADTHPPPPVITPLFYSGIIGLLFIGKKMDSRDQELRISIEVMAG